MSCNIQEAVLCTRAYEQFLQCTKFIKFCSDLAINVRKVKSIKNCTFNGCFNIWLFWMNMRSNLSKLNDKKILDLNREIGLIGQWTSGPGTFNFGKNWLTATVAQCSKNMMFGIPKFTIHLLWKRKLKWQHFSVADTFFDEK